MGRVLTAADIGGMSPVAWTFLWLAVGVVVGVGATLLLWRSCKDASTRRQYLCQTGNMDTQQLPGNPLMKSAALLSTIEFRSKPLEPGLANTDDAYIPSAGQGAPTRAQLHDEYVVEDYCSDDVVPQLPADGHRDAHVHNRSMSVASVVSVDPGAEYEEADLSDDWKELLDDVNSLLATKSKDPINSSRERAVVMNSLVKSTNTRERDDCVKIAAKELLTHRKMQPFHP